MPRRLERGCRPRRAIKPAAPEIDIAVRVLDAEWRRLWPSGVGRCRNAARAVLATAWDRRRGGLEAPIELTIVLADDGAVRQLNLAYRGIDKPTNVLSFGGLDGRHGGTSHLPVVLGDVILARETVAAEAEAQEKTVADHAAHLVVHGVLHLLGHDHRTAKEAASMERIEIDVLAELGVGDPYVLPPRQCRRRQA